MWIKILKTFVKPPVTYLAGEVREISSKDYKKLPDGTAKKCPAPWDTFKPNNKKTATKKTTRKKSQRTPRDKQIKGSKTK